MPDDRAGTAAAAEIFEPRGAVELERRQTSPRKASLSGLRLAILDNSEWNANKLLHGAAAALADQIAFASANCDVKTRSFSTDAPPEQAARFAAENDVAPTAIGDCGSCCYFCSRDAVALADLGLPSAPIIATEFVDETRLTRQAVGMPDLRSVAIDHPSARSPTRRSPPASPSSRRRRRRSGSAPGPISDRGARVSDEFDVPRDIFAGPTLWFEDFEVGEEFCVPSRTITDALFAALQPASGDDDPIRCDVQCCKARGHPGLLAYCMQILIQTAAGAGAFRRQVSDALAGMLEISGRILGPVSAGDVPYPRLTVSGLKPQTTPGLPTLKANGLEPGRRQGLRGRARLST